jgi:hypothetical protein
MAPAGVPNRPDWDLEEEEEELHVYMCLCVCMCVCVCVCVFSHTAHYAHVCIHAYLYSWGGGVCVEVSYGI